MVVGFAQKRRTHTKAERWFHYNSIHSEFDVIRQVWGRDLSEYYLVNIRVLMDGRLSLSKPCRCCANMLSEAGLKAIYFSRSDGSFGSLKL